MLTNDEFTKSSFSSFNFINFVNASVSFANYSLIFKCSIHFPYLHCSFRASLSTQTVRSSTKNCWTHHFLSAEHKSLKHLQCFLVWSKMSLGRFCLQPLCSQFISFRNPSFGTSIPFPCYYSSTTTFKQDISLKSRTSEPFLWVLWRVGSNSCGVNVGASCLFMLLLLVLLSSLNFCFLVGLLGIRLIKVLWREEHTLYVLSSSNTGCLCSLITSIVSICDNLHLI